MPSQPACSLPVGANSVGHGATAFATRTTIPPRDKGQPSVKGDNLRIGGFLSSAWTGRVGGGGAKPLEFTTQRKSGPVCNLICPPVVACARGLLSVAQSSSLTAWRMPAGSEEIVDSCFAEPRSDSRNRHCHTRAPAVESSTRIANFPWHPPPFGNTAVPLRLSLCPYSAQSSRTPSMLQHLSRARGECLLGS